jgi:hypothetical protein
MMPDVEQAQAMLADKVAYYFQGDVEPTDAEPIEPMRRTRRPSLSTIIKQAEKAGLSVTEIRPDGTVITGKSDEAKPTNIDLNGAAPIDHSEWD